MYKKDLKDRNGLSWKMYVKGLLDSRYIFYTKQRIYIKNVRFTGVWFW